MVLLSARLLMIAFGCAAILWGVATLPIFWRHARFEALAARLEQGEPVDPSWLQTQVPALDAIEKEMLCRPAAMHADAVIRFWLAEDAIKTSDRFLVMQKMAALRVTLLRGLTCSPSDAYLWFALFWEDATRNGSAAVNFDYLRMSYRLGPKEGWIGVRRNHLALELFAALPKDLRTRAVDEFVDIVDAGLIVPAAELLTGPGMPIQDLLLARLADVPRSPRERLAAFLQSTGSELRVPGVAPRMLRPSF